MTEDDAPEPEQGESSAEPEAAASARSKPTKAEKLEAKAARLREAEERRAADAAAGTLPPRRGLVIATAALAVATVALATLLIITFLAWQHQQDVTQHQKDIANDRVKAATNSAATLDAARAAATEAANTFALDFGTYDYQHLDTEFQEVAQKMTPDFAKSYLQTSDKLKRTFEQYKTQVTAEIQDWGVMSASTSKATVIVFLDQTVLTSQSTTPRIDRNRLEIQLVHTDGKWLVSKLLAK
jgi:Mce-associated membrane protein